MKKALVLFIIVCQLGLDLPSPVSAGIPPAGSEPAGVEPAAAGPAMSGPVIRQTGEELQVSWQTPPVQTVSLPDGSLEVRMAGFDAAQTPGALRLPEDSLLVALPPGANPTLDVQIAGTEPLSLPGPLGRVPGEVVVPGTAGERVFDLAQPIQPPAEPVSFEEIGVMRGVRLARLTFRPVRLDSGTLEVIRQASATVHFGTPGPVEAILSTEAAAHDQGVAFDPTLAALARQVANPAHLAVSSPVQPASTALAGRAGQAAVEVSAAGLTAITRAALSAAGFPVETADPRFLHLERAGVEIPMEWEGNDNAVFEPGEQLLFYAHPRFSRWTGRDVYFLSSSSTPRAAMPERAAAPAGLPTGSLWLEALFEQNALYTPDCYCAPIPAGRDGDRWVWDVLRKPDRLSATYPVSLEAVDETRPAEVMVWLIGYTDVPHTAHTVQVRLNGTLLGELTFAGKRANPANQATLAIPAGVLTAGSNSLTLSLAEEGPLVDGIWLDAFSFRYARDASPVAAPLAAPLEAGGAAEASQYPVPVSTDGLRAYDVTDPDAPVRLLGIAVDADQAVLADPSSGLPRRYALVPTGTLRLPDTVRMAIPLSPMQGADYILISHPDFLPDLADLAMLRQSQGLQVVVEDVRAIYDAADGRPQPEAIQAYLARAYARWNPRPAYVLLVGDGTTDPRQYRPDSSATWIPPFLADVDPVIGEVAADNRFVMVDGSDNLPDLSIGRLPVNSHVEAAITITRITRYDRQPVPGEWSRRMLLVSDKNDPSAGYFAAENAALTSAYANGRYGLVPLDYAAVPSQADMHQAVLAGWNQGYGLILYNGHASTHQWGVDALFHLNDLPALVNGSRLPVLLEMTCLTGAFQVPNVPTLDETLVRRSGKGAAAAWGSTGLGLSSGAMLLAHGFLDPVMAGPNLPLGSAIGQAKLHLAATAPALGYLLDTFTLLGDPAMQVSYRYGSYLPVVQAAAP